MGKKEKLDIFTPPVVKKYKVEVVNATKSNCKVIIGNQGHSMECLVYSSKAQLPRYWEIEFSDVPDIKLYTPSGAKKSFGLRESHAVVNAFVIQEDCVVCKNSNPLQPRHTSASPDIYGTTQESHVEVVKNSSRKECSYFIGDDWHNVSGSLDSGGFITWKLVISRVPNIVNHQWCKIDELGSRRNKFSLIGSRKSLDEYDGGGSGDGDDDEFGKYRDHVFEVNDNWELLRDGGRVKLWKWDYE